MNIPWLTRLHRRERLSATYQALTGNQPTAETIDLLDDPDFGTAAMELLRMGVSAAEITDAIDSARLVADRADCSPMYAAQFVANVRIFTDAPLAPPMLAQWLKPEWVPAEVND